MCDAAEVQADGDSSFTLIDRRASLVETLSDEELESLKILSGGITIMLVRAYNTPHSVAVAPHLDNINL